MLLGALLLLVEALLALRRILLLALGKFLPTLSLVRLRLLTLLSLILLTGLAELLLPGTLILPRLRGLTLEPARLLLVLRTLRLRRPILVSLTAKALL